MEIGFLLRNKRKAYGSISEVLGERFKEGFYRNVHPMLRYYVENGARSMGCGMRFASLKRRCPEDYAYLMEERLQKSLF